MNKVNYHVTNDTLTVSYEGKYKVIKSDNPLYGELRDLIKVGDEAGILEALNRKANTVSSAYGSKFVVDEAGIVSIDGVALPRTLGDRLVEWAKAELPCEPLLNFWDRLKDHYSYRVVQRLFESLERNHHPIAPDGRFLAYKRVKQTSRGLVDFYTGKFNNDVGSKPKVARNQVDDNQDNECSDGLHVASFEYADKHYHSGEGIVVEVLVDPRDVVAIPKDYNSQKMRVCTYEVVQVCEAGERKEEIYNLPDDDYDDYSYDDDDDDCGC